MGGGYVVQADDLDLGAQRVLLRERDEFAELVEGAPDARHEAGLVGHQAQAEGDAPAVEPDEDDDALPRDVLSGRGQGGLGADEVEDGMERALDLSRGNRGGSAELEGLRALGLRRIHDDDLGVSEDAQELHGVLAKTACTDDECARIGDTAQRVEGVPDRAVGGESAAGEWRGKAGGYAIQGLAGTFVARLVGSYTAVVGLPLYETVSLLAGAGYPVLQPWFAKA